MRLGTVFLVGTVAVGVEGCWSSEPTDLKEPPQGSPGQGIEEHPDKDLTGGETSDQLSVDPSLSPDILAAQLEHLLVLQDDIATGMVDAGSSAGHRRLSELDSRVARLVDTLTRVL